MVILLQVLSTLALALHGQKVKLVIMFSEVMVVLVVKRGFVGLSVFEGEAFSECYLSSRTDLLPLSTQTIVLNFWYCFWQKLVKVLFEPKMTKNPLNTL